MRIEIDTQYLSNDIKTMEEQKADLQKSKQLVFACMDEVNAMWEGQAHDQFLVQVMLDSQRLDALLSSINNLIECMQHAKAEYEKCSDAVSDKIASLRMSNDK